MKNLLFLILFYLGAQVSLCAQPFAPIGAEWYYSYWLDALHPYDAEYSRFESLSDTLMDGRSLRKIGHTHYRYDGMEEARPPLFLEISGDSVWRYLPETGRAYLQYVMGAGVGDTIAIELPGFLHPPGDTTVPGVVTGVSVDTFAGETVRRVSIEALSFLGAVWSQGHYWDWVGSVWSPLPDVGVLVGAAYLDIRCYRHNGREINFWGRPCDYRQTVSTEDAAAPQIGVTLHPNPTEGLLRVRTDAPVQGTVQVHCMLGRPLLSMALAAPSADFPLDVSGLPAGVYTLLLPAQDGWRQTAVRFVKH